jgi:hypothetical protein
MRYYLYIANVRVRILGKTYTIPPVPLIPPALQAGIAVSEPTSWRLYVIAFWWWSQIAQLVTTVRLHILSICLHLGVYKIKAKIGPFLSKNVWNCDRTSHTRKNGRTHAHRTHILKAFLHAHRTRASVRARVRVQFFFCNSQFAI